MEQQTVTLKLPQTLLKDASCVAATENVTIGQLVRKLLKVEVDRRLKTRQPNGKQNRQQTEIKTQLGTEISLADGWDDLAARLCDLGYELRPDGTGLAICCRFQGSLVCNTDELGFPYAKLVGRFECAMPGHPEGAAKMKVILSLPIQPRLPLEGDSTFEVVDFDA